MAGPIVTEFCTHVRIDVGIDARYKNDPGWVGIIFEVFFGSAGSILDISKYRDTCEHSISILLGMAILRYIE